MKTFKIIIATALIVLIAVIGGTSYFLIDEGIVTISERGTTHTREVYEDGNLKEKTTWFEKTGTVIDVNVVDQMVIGQ